MSEEDTIEPEGVVIGGMFHPFFYDVDCLKVSQVRGQYLGDEGKILLDTKLPERILLRTIFHEALHGVFGMSTLTAGQVTSERELTEELEEKVITLMEREIPQLFRDNPWLMKVLRSDGKED